MNPEFIDQIIDLDRIMTRACEKAERALEVDAIDMNDFTDLYGADQVRADEQIVATKEAEFAATDSDGDKEYRKFGLIFEAIIHEQAELSDWFGHNAMTMKGSRFDDIFHGVDGIFEFPREDMSFSHLEAF